MYCTCVLYHALEIESRINSIFCSFSWVLTVESFQTVQNLDIPTVHQTAHRAAADLDSMQGVVHVY